MDHVLRLGLAIAAIGYFGCASDPSLQIEVVHDPAIAAVVDHTVVSIYAQMDLTCAQIEFGDISDDQLRGALAAEASDGEALSGIPRVDAKVIVARGYSAAGALVAAGCVAEGEITDRAKVTVTTVPTATVSVTLAADDTGGAAMGNGILVTTTDATNASIDKREVAWRLYGAAGTTADPARYHDVADGEWEPLHPTCTANGDARIHPMPPLLPGGFGLDVRVSWASAMPPLFTAFTAFDAAAQTVSQLDKPAILLPCALEKRAGKSRIACMDSPTSVQLYDFAPATHTVTKGVNQALGSVAGDSWIGVIAVEGAGGDRDLYAISDKGAWQALDGAPAAAGGTQWCAGACNAAWSTTGLQYVPACGDSPAFLFGQGKVGLATQYFQMPVRGGAATLYPPLDGSRGALKGATVTGAGCVTELQLDGSSKLRQALVFDSTPTSGPETNAVFACSATASPCVVQLPTSNQAVAFSGGAGEAQLIGGTFDATGTQLARWVMKPAEVKGGAGAKDRLVERSRQVSAAPARQLVTGKFDADADADLFWTFLGRNAFGVQIAYARQVHDAPLSAVTSFDLSGIAALANPTPVQLFAADFNGDGYDELILVYQYNTLGATSIDTVTVFDAVPTGIPYGNPPSPPDDAACN